ncbi:MAG TPA: hypothetical protein PKC45_03095, partial [Gemmatales bacterium]|nr:hypothetical protein [Gemmatales bacterium]
LQPRTPQERIELAHGLSICLKQLPFRPPSPAADRLPKQVANRIVDAGLEQVSRALAEGFTDKALLLSDHLRPLNRIPEIRAIIDRVPDPR